MIEVTLAQIVGYTLAIVVVSGLSFYLLFNHLVFVFNKFHFIVELDQEGRVKSVLDLTNVEGDDLDELERYGQDKQ